MELPPTPQVSAAEIDTALRPLRIAVISFEARESGGTHVCLAMAKALMAKVPGSTLDEHYNVWHQTRQATWEKMWPEGMEPDIIIAEGPHFPTRIRDKYPFIVDRDDYEKYKNFEPTISHLPFIDKAKESARFKKYYPAFARPLIAVCAAYDKDETLWQKMENIISRYEKGTVFLTSSPRTDKDEFENTARLAGELAKAKPDLQFLSYAYQSGRAYNPYHGLLLNADVIVLCDRSDSMLADARSTNATIYVNDRDEQNLGPYCNVPELYEFNGELPIAARVVSDSTKEVAQEILQNYRQWLKKGGPEYGPE